MAACQVPAPQISGAASGVLRYLPLDPGGPGVRGAVADPAPLTGARYGMRPGVSALNPGRARTDETGASVPSRPQRVAVSHHQDVPIFTEVLV